MIMKLVLITHLFLFFNLLFQRYHLILLCIIIESYVNYIRGAELLANTPPRGWNSYDSFCWTISEQEFLQNAELVAKRLHCHGYEYVVVDYLWYREKVDGAYVDSLGFDNIDEWGRMIPDPVRWPSSKGGKGFTEVAEKVHRMGLKFGIHVMRGVSTQAFNANTPILDIHTGRVYEESGRQWHAKDIGIKERTCQWMQNGFMSVNTKLGAGRAFLRSLYQQYAHWGVDFVKNDCVFGEDLDIDEITYVSELLRKLDRPILYSLSPGTSVTPAMAKSVSHLVNMYRITGDDWDTWGDVVSHFDVTRDISASGMIGAQSLNGKSWPDLDMLPLGWLTDAGSNEGPHRYSKLTLDEQRTQMTLWSIAKSPLMFGGDMRKLDEKTLSLITNPTLLEINSFSSNNKEFPSIISDRSDSQSSKVKRGKNGVMLESSILRLTSCHENRAQGWLRKALDNDLEQICWKGNSRGKHQSEFCLEKRKLSLPIDENMAYDGKYQDKIHLSAAKRKGFCFGASSHHKRTSKELKRVAFSPCKWNTNQMWELNGNGTLTNSYSGLCASINSVKATTGGIRAWIATGRKGETYVAIFNLESDRARVSAKMADIFKALQPPQSKNTPCSGKEIWSGRTSKVGKSVTTDVEPHGCALFVLDCS
ncbi:hypothetical protein Leryth_018089 [Lithospermum erythrorhizon]|nr:hypothetical protein Leryth_018089 [Lithospermum erythrorhizon]